jgi:hypothetical protein
LNKNKKIGVIDLKVYKNIELNKKFVYSAAGIYTRYTNDKFPTLFYINKDLNNDNVIFALTNEIFKSKYYGIT